VSAPTAQVAGIVRHVRQDICLTRHPEEAVYLVEVDEEPEQALRRSRPAPGAGRQRHVLRPQALRPGEARPSARRTACRDTPRMGATYAAIPALSVGWAGARDRKATVVVYTFGGAEGHAAGEAARSY